jgi:hypothetical protein
MKTLGDDLVTMNACRERQADERVAYSQGASNPRANPGRSRAAAAAWGDPEVRARRSAAIKAGKAPKPGKWQI